MPLTCGCDYDPEPGQHIGYVPESYDILRTKKRQRCLSCKVLISVGETVGKCEIFRIPKSDVEIRIYGDDEDSFIPLADRYFCEDCTDICFNLEGQGFECLSPFEDMQDLLYEFIDMRNEL